MNNFPQPPLVKQLMEEHEIIERLVGSLYRWSLEGQEADSGARGIFVEFFRLWARGFHHQQEEEILFPALVEKAEVPGDRGPLKVLIDEHEREVALVGAFETAQVGSETAAIALELAHLLWMHIDKENSVVLFEAGERLVRSGAGDIEGREETPAEKASREAAEELLERWPPLEDDDLIRGDGCMGCSAYGDTCSGIEKEWWNAWEWEHHLSMEG